MGASEAHREAASLHDKVGGAEHKEASRLHTRKADKFDANRTKREERCKNYSLSNKDAFRDYEATDDYLTKCMESKARARQMVSYLENGHHQKALNGAPRRWHPFGCGVEPF